MNVGLRARWATAGAIAVIALIFWWLHAHNRPLVATQDTSPAVATARVRIGNIDVTVPAVGRLGASAGAQTKLAFATSGRIATVDVHVGERVGAGEALASLDTTPLALQAEQASADARAAAAQAQAAAVDRTSTRIAVDLQTVSREARLYAAGVAAAKDVTAARAQLAADRADAQAASAGVEAARAQSRSAIARASLASRDLRNGVLRAPIDGVVTAIYHQPGESVDPTLAVVAIAPGSTSNVALDVAANDAVRVSPGDSVRLRLESTGQTISGRVFGVAGAVDPTTQSAQILVHASVPAALAGSAVDAQIIVAHDRGTLVPKDAIVADPATGKTLVFVKTRKPNGGIRYDGRSVRVVFENTTTAEVRGLGIGEEIAASGGFELLPPAGGG